MRKGDGRGKRQRMKCYVLLREDEGRRENEMKEKEKVKGRKWG